MRLDDEGGEKSGGGKKERQMIVGEFGVVKGRERGFEGVGKRGVSEMKDG